MVLIGPSPITSIKIAATDMETVWLKTGKGRPLERNGAYFSFSHCLVDGRRNTLRYLGSGLSRKKGRVGTFDVSNAAAKR